MKNCRICIQTFDGLWGIPQYICHYTARSRTLSCAYFALEIYTAVPRLCHIPSLLVGPALLAALELAAQQAPTAGTQLQQIPASPSTTAAAPDWQASPLPAQTYKLTDSTPLLVTALTFEGNQVFASTTLERISGFTAGNRYTLNALRELAAKITAHYREQGYFLAQTLIPIQDITEGTVRFAVLEGRYGQIELNNQSGVADNVVHALLQGLQNSEAATQENLERSILLLNDVPGVQAQSTLRPGRATGTADLQIRLSAGPTFSGSLEMDNQGNHYTGTYRLGSSFHANNPLGLGDRVSARLLTSGEGLSFGRVAYQLPAGSLTVGVAASSLYYQLGGAFASLQSSGTAHTGTVFANYPLVRARQQNLNAQWTIDAKEFDDRTGAGSPSQSSKRSHIHTLGLKGSFQNTHGNGVGHYTVSWAHGTISLQDATTRNQDASTARSQGDFDKLGYSFAWLQENAEKRSLYVSLSGQWASKNLDASEKFSLGGSTGVRAYPAGEASGDEGLLLTLEGRTHWPTVSQYLGGAAQAVAFVDMGTEIANKNPWDAGSSTQRRTLRGIGLGLNFSRPQQWVASAYCAFKLGNEAATSAPDAAWRLWLQAARFF